MHGIALTRRIVVHKAIGDGDCRIIERDIQMEDGAGLGVAAFTVLSMWLVTHHQIHNAVLVPRLGAEVEERWRAKRIIFRVRIATDGLARELCFL